MGTLSKHGAITNIRIPPESTGPRVQMQRRLDLEITAPVLADGSINFWEYPTITGLTSSANGTVVFYADIEGSANKQVSVVLDIDSPLSFVNGETLIVEGETGHGDRGHTHTVTLISVVEVFVPANMIVSGRNPLNTLDVSRKGALYVTSPEGDQQIDGWGISKTSQNNVVGVHAYFGFDDTVETYNQLTASGTVTPNPVSKTLLLDVQTGSTDAVKKTTNKYHYYNPVGATIAKIPVVVGDTGKTNVVRRWGMYDDTDGVFFELDEQTLYVVLRSSTSGTVVDNRVAQSVWNGDRVDGSGGVFNLSGINLDVSKMNMYFVEIPSSNAGRYRFGAWGSAGRVIFHTIEASNVNTLPTMTRTSHPLRWEIFNKGPSASPSRLTIAGGIVETEGNVTEDSVLPAVRGTYEVPEVTVGSDWTHVASFRSGLYLPGTTVTNRRRTIPNFFTYYVKDAPIAVQVRVGVVMGGTPNFFQAHPLSPAEADISGTFPASPLARGVPIITRRYSTGVTQVEAPKDFSLYGSQMVLRADGNYGLMYTFVAKSLEATPAKVNMSVDWKDY